MAAAVATGAAAQEAVRAALADRAAAEARRDEMVGAVERLAAVRERAGREREADRERLTVLTTRLEAGAAQKRGQSRNRTVGHVKGPG